MNVSLLTLSVLSSAAVIMDKQSSYQQVKKISSSVLIKLVFLLLLNALLFAYWLYSVSVLCFVDQ